MKKKTLIITLILLINLIFVDIAFAETYNNYEKGTASCGIDINTDVPLITNIPLAVPKVVSIAFSIIQVAVPIVLVIFGTLDLFKAITAGKEDEIKKGQQLFIKRLISAVLVFFAFVIVKFAISLVADSSSVRIIDCMECFINNKCTITNSP